MQGMAALKIMVFHFLMQTEYYPRILNVLSFTVTVFIFISGFGLNESYKKNGLQKYWEKRIIRVILPCWIVFLTKIPFVEEFNIADFLKNLFFIDSELWFMDFIIRWYIVFWIAKRFFPKHAAIVLLAYSVVNIFKEQFMSQQAFTFLLGYLTSQHYNKIRLWSKKRILKITIFSILYASIFTFIKQLPPVREYIGTVPFNLLLLNIQFPFATMIIATPYLLPWVKKIPFVNWFGKVSYEIYIVHYNFMPYITGIASILKFTAVSTVISAVFNNINVRLKDKKYQNAILAAIFYIAICYILACKYTMRITDNFGYICLSYITLLGCVTLLFTSDRLRYRLRWPKASLWIVLTLLAAAMLAVQYHFDPMENKVDRWSAIANPLTALFNGDFPYLAKTHLGGNSSPFPVWLVLHIPFWALGNVGLSEIFTAILFLYSIKAAYGNGAALKAAVLLGLSVNLWYETAVRSDLISNFLLLAAFINMLVMKQTGFYRRPYLLSAVAALWLSTRLSTAFPLFIMFFPDWLRLSTGRKVATLLMVVAVFCLTFLPLAVWDWDSLFYAENNPFSLQGRQGRPADTVVMLLAAVLMALKWRGNTGRLMLYSAAILILVPVLAYGHNMYVYDNWTDVFNSAYDITYLDAALPFCITLVAAWRTGLMQAKNPNL